MSVSNPGRFVVVPNILLDDEKIVILLDFHFWADHEIELTNWCNSRNAVFKGMTVVFSDEVTLLEFVLRWA